VIKNSNQHLGLRCENSNTETQYIGKQGNMILPKEDWDKIPIKVNEYKIDQ
jgi:hypothetical protein